MDNLWLKVENIAAKGEIARFEQLFLLSLCFQEAVCCRAVRKRLYEGKGLVSKLYLEWLVRKNVRQLFNPFYIQQNILQQMYSNIFCQKIENLYNWMDNLWLKVENIVANREIARFEQFLFFLKAVSRRGVRKRLYYEEKVKSYDLFWCRSIFSTISLLLYSRGL